MHLGNGAITPECAVVTYGAAAAGLSAAAVSLRRIGLSRSSLETAAVIGGLVLAAQAVNVPVASWSSAHLVGGALLAALLGPALGAWTMAFVLLAQAFALGDGGLTALGANVLNMAILPAALVALAKRATARELSPVAVGVLATCSLILAAALIVGETAMFRSTGELTGWTSFAGIMLGVHSWIGVLEGIATAAILVAVPRLVSSPAASLRWRGALFGLVAVAMIATLLLPVSSSRPDGYEAAARASGMGWLLNP